MHRVVVVGGGLAGMSVVAALRDAGYSDGLTLLCGEGWLPYDRPPLSKDYLLGGGGPDGLVLADEGWYAERDVDVRLAARVERLRLDLGCVELADGTLLGTDDVVLATGGTARPLRVSGGDGPAVHLLRSRQDADRLREGLVPGARVLAVGGGLIGSEVASAAVALGCEVTVVDPVRLPLAGVVGPRAAELLLDLHARHGVEVIEAGVTGITPLTDGGPVTVTLEQPRSSREVEADVVVAGIGIQPDTALAEDAGVAVDAGVLVDRSGRTTLPHVFAAGDVVRRIGPDGPERRSEHWDAARRTAQAAAAGVLDHEPPAESAPWFWSDRYGTHLEVVGSDLPGAQPVFRGEAAPDGFSVFFVLDGRCVGAAALDRRRDVRTARRLVDRRIPVEATELADVGVDLRGLLER